MVLINIGVHKLESYKNNDGIFENSYFIHRPYLNYVIFSPNSTELFYDYFNSKGGVGKQIFTHHKQISHSQAKIFNKYGAAVLLTNPTKQPHNNSYKCEYYGEDFSDKDIIYPWDNPKELHWFILTQKGKNFLVTDEHLILNDGVWSPNPSLHYNEEKIRDIEEVLNHKIDYLLPRMHSGEFYLQKTPYNELKKQITHFKGQLK